MALVLGFDMKRLNEMHRKNPMVSSAMRPAGFQVMDTKKLFDNFLKEGTIELHLLFQRVGRHITRRGRIMVFKAVTNRNLDENTFTIP